MKITVTQLPGTKLFVDKHRKYIATYPNGYPIHVRRIWNCNDCDIEVGGYFGNKVYGDAHLKLCNDCKVKYDIVAQLCVAQTGMTPVNYQEKHGRAWNE